MFPEAHPGPPVHRVPPARLHLQREPPGHRETPQLPGQRGAQLHLPGGADVRLQRVSDQHHRMHHVRLRGGDASIEFNQYSDMFHDFY